MIFLKKELEKALNFEEVLIITLDTIAFVKREDPKIKIGYVSGKVTADGEENIQKNLQRMEDFTNEIRKNFGGFVFSAADVVSKESYWKQNLPRPIHENEFYSFWQEVLGGGVTDIFMMSGWESSVGANDEHETAKKLGITIHYPD